MQWSLYNVCTKVFTVYFIGTRQGINFLICSSTIVILEIWILYQQTLMYWVSHCSRCGRDYCTSQEIMSTADAMASNGMKEAGYEYIIVSGERRGDRKSDCDTYCTCLPLYRLLGRPQSCWWDHSARWITLSQVRYSSEALYCSVMPVDISDLQWSRTCHPVCQLKGIQTWTGKRDDLGFGSHHSLNILL